MDFEDNFTIIIRLLLLFFYEKTFVMNVTFSNNARGLFGQRKQKRSKERLEHFL